MDTGIKLNYYYWYDPDKNELIITYAMDKLEEVRDFFDIENVQPYTNKEITDLLDISKEARAYGE